MLEVTCMYISIYNLRSSNECMLSMPKRITKKTLGDRAFQVAAPRLWNNLPTTVKAGFHFGEFGRAIKGWAIRACAARNPS